MKMPQNQSSLNRGLPKSKFLTIQLLPKPAGLKDSPGGRSHHFGHRGYTRFAWAGLLCLVVSASAGQLDSKWSGSIEWEDDTFYNISSKVGSRISLNSGMNNQYLRAYRWENRYNRTVSVDVANGGCYTIGILGSFHMVGDDAVYVATNQPTKRDCDWGVVSEAPIQFGSSGGSLSVDVKDDCSYAITLDGLEVSCNGHYDLTDFSIDKQLCGYANLSGDLPRTFAGEVPPIQARTTDKNHLEGTLSKGVAGVPDWCSSLARDMIQAICAGAPATESASIAAVAQVNPFALGYLSTTKWNLRRSSSGHWAGTLTYTLKYVDGGPGAMTQSMPAGAAGVVGTTTTKIWKDGSVGYVTTLPEDGNTPSAHIFEHVTNHYTVTTVGQKTCGRITVPYSDTITNLGTLDADDTVQSGVAVTIDTTLAPSNQASIFVETPSITEQDNYIYVETTLDGCDGDSNYQVSYPSQHEFWMDDYGQEDWFVDLNCGSNMKGSNSQTGGGTQETWTWDLHFVEDEADQPAARATKFSMNATGIKPLDAAQAGAAIPVTGTIQCWFAYANASTNEVPDGQPQAGSIFQTLDSFQYAANLMDLPTGGFQAVVQAGEQQTNRIDTLETQICTVESGTTVNTSTNSVPLSCLETLVASLSNTVQAAVLATLTNNEYRVHVEIPAAQNGHRESIRNTTRQPRCANVPTNTIDRFASDDWGTGTRVLDFRGTLDPADPTTLSGRTQMDHGWITWHLKTSVSPDLRLGIESTTDRVVRLTWNASPNVRLQQCDSLTGRLWQDVPNTLGTNNAAIQPAAKTLFFRLIRQ